MDKELIGHVWLNDYDKNYLIQIRLNIFHKTIDVFHISYDIPIDQMLEMLFYKFYIDKYVEVDDYDDDENQQFVFDYELEHEEYNR